MQRTRPVTFFAIAAAVCLPAVLAWSQTKAPKVVKRAQPPKLDNSGGEFYDDAFKDGLVGERPANLGQTAATAVVGTGTPGGSAAGSGATGIPGSGWSGLISAATIEDEVKSLKLQVEANVTTPSDFAGKGYKLARRDFSVLAMLFGIAGEYDGEVRWKKDAPAARDVFARTAANAKVGTSQVFQEAKLRRDELGDLVNGSSPFGGKEAEAKATWKDVCNRAPLMQHLESIWEPRLKPLLADKGQFTANGSKIAHDAEMIAAIGDVLAKNGMADADDDEYQAFCAKLRDGGKAIAEAVKVKNFDAAAAGSGIISKSCVACHENYRS
jgi:cytochrome c556